MKRQKSYIRIVKLTAFAAITGILVGAVTALFVVAAKVITSFVFVTRSAENAPLAVCCFVLLALLCCFCAAVVQQIVPVSKGSGIPLAECCARGMRKVRNPFSAVAALIVGSLLSFLAGMPLGSEGPSVGIGGLIGEGVGKLTRRPAPFTRYLITGGASAGLAAAFNTPITGIAFALEETHRRFSPDILLSAISAVAFGALTSQAIFLGFGMIPYLASLDIRAGFFALAFIKQATPDGWWLPRLFGIALVCGAVSALLAVAFNRAVELIGKRLNGVRPLFRLLPAFALTAVAGSLLYLTVGSGEAMLHTLANNPAVWLVITLLAVRFVLTVVASGSGATGGLFIPMIAIGGLCGMIAGKVCGVCGLPERFIPNIVMLCVAAFFAASVRAPLSAIALSVELTGSLVNVLPCVAAVGIAVAIADLTRTEPLYERMMNDLKAKEYRSGLEKLAVIAVTGVVKLGSVLCGKHIRNVLWPYNSLVISLNRDGAAIVPDGETRLLDGDVITVTCETADPDKFRAELREYLYIPPTITDEVRKNL